MSIIINILRYSCSVSDVFVRDASPARLSYQVVTLANNEGIIESVVSVSQPGVLLSADKTGTATLLVTAHEEFGINHTIQVLVKVSLFLQNIQKTYFV